MKKLKRMFHGAVDSMLNDTASFVGIDKVSFDIVDVAEKEVSEFFDDNMGKFVVSDLEVSGSDLSAYLVIEPALIIGMAGRLLMIPANEIAKQQKEQSLDEDILDSASEIANILCGVLSEKIVDADDSSVTFKKRDIHQVNVASGDADGFGADGDAYAIVTSSVVLDSDAPSRMVLMIPVAALGVESEQGQQEQSSKVESGVANEEPAPPKQDTSKPVQSPDASAEVEAVEDPSGDVAAEGRNEQSIEVPRDTVVIMVESGEVPDVLLSHIESKSLNLVKSEGLGEIPAHVNPFAVAVVFLILEDYGPKAASFIIKLRSKLPEAVSIVTVAKGWTREQVIEAYGYGSRDIMLLPVGDEEYIEKLSVLS